tara:strand:+ start:130 stop:372 length:243 start_codon:yes stop_codon:yes gene_type:complete
MVIRLRKNSKGNELNISFLFFKISLYVKGNKISQTVNHLKNVNEYGGISSKKANFPITKLPAQNNVAKISIKYALMLFVI